MCTSSLNLYVPLILHQFALTPRHSCVGRNPVTLFISLMKNLELLFVSDHNGKE